MITYAFINVKGGVGKTTIAVNTAYAFVSGSLRVLFIDNDKQGNASMFFGARDKDKTLADVFTVPDIDIHDVIYPARKFDKGYIDVLPANMSLLPLNMEHKDIAAGGADKTFILKNALKAVESEYDVCIIDNPPDINFTVYNGLIATNQVIIVTNPDNYSEAGADEMDRQFENVLRDRQQFDPDYDESDPANNFVLRGALLNKYVPITYDKMAGKYKFFRTNIRLASTYETNRRLLESIRSGKSVLEISPRCVFSKEIIKFVDELLYGA